MVVVAQKLGKNLECCAGFHFINTGAFANTQLCLSIHVSLLGVLAHALVLYRCCLAPTVDRLSTLLVRPPAIYINA